MSDPAYISVLQWAEGTSAHDQIEAVVASCAIDPYDAEQKVRKGVPQVLMRVESGVAEAMLDEFSRRGVMAFAPLRRQMQSLGDAPRIKRLMPMHNGAGYVCEMWREQGTAFKFSDVFCFVRAKLRSGETRTHVESNRHAQVGGYMVGGVGGAMIAASMSNQAVRNTKISTTDILDIYLRDGRRLRLDSDKLNFDVLGDKKSYTDHTNMKLLTEKLRQEVPRAMFDEGFGSFVCPMEFNSDRVRALGDSTVRSRSDAGPFEFYSVWAYLMYAHLLGGG